MFCIFFLQIASTITPPQRCVQYSYHQGQLYEMVCTQRSNQKKVFQHLHFNKLINKRKTVCKMKVPHVHTRTHTHIHLLPLSVSRKNEKKMRRQRRKTKTKTPSAPPRTKEKKFVRTPDSHTHLFQRLNWTDLKKTKVRLTTGLLKENFFFTKITNGSHNLET